MFRHWKHDVKIVLCSEQETKGRKIDILGVKKPWGYSRVWLNSATTEYIASIVQGLILNT